MKKSALCLLIVFCSIAIDVAIAWAIDVQATPVEQKTLAHAEGEKPSTSIGPRDPEKEKQHGVSLNIFLNKDVAVTSSFSLLPPVQSLQPGQVGNYGGLGLNPSQFGGAVGFKIFFK